MAYESIKLKEQQLFAKFIKCDFFKERIKYLGHVVSNDGISIDPDKSKAITEWSIPKNVTDIISFMGITRYYRKFIEWFSKISYLITSLQKKHKKFDWSEKCTEIFNKLKHMLTIPPILKIGDPFKDFVV